MSTVLLKRSQKYQRQAARRGSVLRAPKRETSISDSVDYYRRQHQRALFFCLHENQSSDNTSNIDLHSATKSSSFHNAEEKNELRMLRKKQELLYCFLPQEVVNSIQHHWHDSIDNVQALESLSSTSSVSLENSSIHSSIVYENQETNDDDDENPLAVLESSKHNLQTVKTTETSDINASSSRTLYNEDAKDVTVIFIDIVGFSAICNEIPASEVMDMLRNLFQRFDSICQKYNILKLDTIGDAYLCSVGFFEEHTNDQRLNANGRGCALRALAAAKEMIRESRKVPVPESSAYASDIDAYVSVRIGIHIGDAAFGVLGQSLPKLICVGSAVNMAERMEQTSSVNMIHVTSTFHDLIGDKEDGWECSEKVKVKDIGEIDSYLLDPLKGENESCWC